MTGGDYVGGIVIGLMMGMMIGLSIGYYIAHKTSLKRVDEVLKNIRNLKEKRGEK